jgi:hypothetical protein
MLVQHFNRPTAIRRCCPTGHKPTTNSYAAVSTNTEEKGHGIYYVLLDRKVEEEDDDPQLLHDHNHHVYKHQFIGCMMKE